MAGPGRRGLSRRTLLRGCTAGLAAAVALPTLEAMLNTNGTALADGRALPCRFGVWFWGNGVRLDQWVPSDLGPGYAPSPSLQPLADAGVLPQVSVISGLTVPHGQEVVHDVGRAVMLSGSYSVDEPTVGLGGNAIIRSIDQIAADTLSEGARFRSLEVGVSKVGFGGQPDTASVSWEEPVSPLPAEFSPHALYQRLFGDVLADASFLEARRSVLDVVREDTLDLRAKLGAPDRIRLDAHLDGLRAIEQQLVAIAPSCALPDSPHVLPDQPLANEPLVERATALSDLLVVALSCDLTRVFNFRYSPSAADTYFHPVGAAEAHHVMSHDGGQLEGLQQIVEFIMGQLGYFLQRLSDARNWSECSTPWRLTRHRRRQCW
ncbi:MAG: DUF1552 domain-containing protein [Myxococcota bacterium]